MPGSIIGAAGVCVKCFVRPVRFFLSWGKMCKYSALLPKAILRFVKIHDKMTKYYILILKQMKLKIIKRDYRQVFIYSMM